MPAHHSELVGWGGGRLYLAAMVDPVLTTTAGNRRQCRRRLTTTVDDGIARAWTSSGCQSTWVSMRASRKLPWKDCTGRSVENLDVHAVRYPHRYLPYRAEPGDTNTSYQRFTRGSRLCLQSRASTNFGRRRKLQQLCITSFINLRMHPFTLHTVVI